MLSAEASSAICVQKFDDSRNSAIHTTYRISLRSSSLREPRYPLLRVVSVCVSHHRLGAVGATRFSQVKSTMFVVCCWSRHTSRGPCVPISQFASGCGRLRGNDPSAGSPTETLLRLLLPLNDKV